MFWALVSNLAPLLLLLIGLIPAVIGFVLLFKLFKLLERFVVAVEEFLKYRMNARN